MKNSSKSAFSWGKLPGVCLLGVCLLLAAASILRAQSIHVDLTGIVTDAQEAAVPEVQITVTNVASGVQTLTVSNRAGAYHVGDLIPGTYRVEASHPGFKTFVREDFALTAGQIGRLDIKLEIGAVQQTVTVTGAPTQLQTQSAQVSELVTPQEIEQLPSISRKYTELISLNALTTYVSQSNWQNDTVSIAGGTGNNTGMYFNGAASNDPATGQVLTGIHNEFVQEFQENVNSFSAEFGTSQSFSITTKSGTNQFHGDASLFAQENSWNALPWGATSSLPFHTRDIGGNIGGPIRKNKLHFFFGYQHLHYNTALPMILTVPTEAEKGGDFSQYVNNSGVQIPIYDPNSTKADPSKPGQFIRQQFSYNGTLNVIPPSEMDPVGKAMLSYYPTPNLAGTNGVNNYEGINATLENRPQYYTRVDQQWNQKNSTFFGFDYSKDVTHSPSVYGIPGFSDGNISIYDTEKFLWDIGHTIVPNPSWVLETTWTWNWLRFDTRDDAFDQESSSSGGLGYASKLGLVNPINANFFPELMLSGYGEGGGGAHALFIMPFGSYDLTERVTHVMGKHTMKFGIDWIRSSQQQLGWYSMEILSFGLQPTAQPETGAGGNAAAALLLGFPMGASEHQSLWRRTTQGLQGYFQESWRMRPNLTLDAGLRVEATLPAYIHDPTNDEEVVQGFNPTVINPVSGTPGVMTYPGVGHPKSAFPTEIGVGPRIGIAWQPWGTGSKTVVRAAWGIFPGNITGLGTFTNFGGTTVSHDGNWISPDNGITAPFFLKGGFPALAAGLNPATGQSEPDYPGFGAVPVGKSPVYAPSFAPYNLPIWYSDQYNVSVQHEFPHMMNLEVSYIGNWGVKIPGSMTQDQVLPSLMGPGDAQLLRPFPQYSNVNDDEYENFWSHYNALRVHAEKRYSSGLTFNIDYVFNKNLGDYNAWNAYDLSAGESLIEPRHRFVAFAIYELPWGPGRRWLKSGVMGDILGGWILTPVVRWTAGNWLDVYNSTDTSNAFENGNQGVNLVAGQNPNNGPKTMSQWFNINAFTAPLPFTFGTAGRTLVLGPRYDDVDANLSKRFNVIGERLKAQLQLESTNILNHPLLNNPATTYGAPGFGTVGAKSGNRELEIGIKLIY